MCLDILDTSQAITLTKQKHYTVIRKRKCWKACSFLPAMLHITDAVTPTARVSSLYVQFSSAEKHILPRGDQTCTCPMNNMQLSLSSDRSTSTFSHIKSPVPITCLKGDTHVLVVAEEESECIPFHSP